MAVTTETAIVNRALGLLGAERINSLSDANNRARIMQEAYYIERDALLHSHPWKFATSFQLLALVTPTPTEVFGYASVFQLPSDCLRVIATSLGNYGKWEEIENHRLACNESTLSVKFIKRVTDVTKYSESFVKTLAAKLANATAYTITQSSAQVDATEKLFDKELRAARTFDAQSGGSIKTVQADDWLLARY